MTLLTWHQLYVLLNFLLYCFWIFIFLLFFACLPCLSHTLRAHPQHKTTRNTLQSRPAEGVQGADPAGTEPHPQGRVRPPDLRRAFGSGPGHRDAQRRPTERARWAGKAGLTGWPPAPGQPRAAQAKAEPGGRDHRTATPSEPQRKCSPIHWRWKCKTLDFTRYSW